MSKPITTSTSAPRRRGRPLKADSAIGGAAGLTRGAIADKVLFLARSVSLADISIVQVAREFGVVPGLIYYYIGSREALLAAVMNLYYRRFLAALPPVSGDWRADLERISHAAIAYTSQYPGIARHVATRDRAWLFQQAQANEPDDGVAYFNHVATAILQGGFTPGQAALAYQLWAQFMLACTVARMSQHQQPDHAERLRARFDTISNGAHPAASAVGGALASLDAGAMLDGGLQLLLDGFERWPRSGDRNHC